MTNFTLTYCIMIPVTLVRAMLRLWYHAVPDLTACHSETCTADFNQSQGRSSVAFTVFSTALQNPEKSVFSALPQTVTDVSHRLRDALKHPIWASGVQFGQQQVGHALKGQPANSMPVRHSGQKKKTVVQNIWLYIKMNVNKRKLT